MSSFEDDSTIGKYLDDIESGEVTPIVEEGELPPPELFDLLLPETQEILLRNTFSKPPATPNTGESE